MPIRCFTGVAVAAALIGCTDPSFPGAPPGANGPTTATASATLDPLAAPDVSTTHLAHVDITPPAVEPPPPPREWRRLDIDQVDAAITRTTGRRWMVTGATGALEPGLQMFALTLGKPDYLRSVNEDLSVSLMFEKFLGDAARSTCDQAVDDAEPGLFEYVARDTSWSAETAPAIRENLRHLVLRFHGRSLPMDSDELEPWYWLFESTSFRTGEPRHGWRAVCVALITHPDFIAY